MATGDRNAPERNEAGRAGGTNPRDTDQEGDRRKRRRNTGQEGDRRKRRRKLKRKGAFIGFPEEFFANQPKPPQRARSGARMFKSNKLG